MDLSYSANCDLLSATFPHEHPLAVQVKIEPVGCCNKDGPPPTTFIITLKANDCYPNLSHSVKESDLDPKLKICTFYARIRCRGIPDELKKMKAYLFPFGKCAAAELRMIDEFIQIRYTAFTEGDYRLIPNMPIIASTIVG